MKHSNSPTYLLWVYPAQDLSLVHQIHFPAQEGKWGRSFHITRVWEWGCISSALGTFCKSLCVSGCPSPFHTHVQTPSQCGGWRARLHFWNKSRRDATGCCWVLGVQLRMLCISLRHRPLHRAGEQTSTFIQLLDLSSSSCIPLKKEIQWNLKSGPIQVIFNSCFASGHFQLKYEPLPSYI